MAKQPGKILLGCGKFKINNKEVGLTRGMGSFVVERVYREIVADCDKGQVKGRVVLDESRPKLTMNLLEIIADDLSDVFPATQSTSASGKTMFSAKSEIEDSDFVTVEFIGKTKDGKPVHITVKEAINKENINWAFEDKGEVINTVTFEGSYTDADTATDIEPWTVEFGA